MVLDDVTHRARRVVELPAAFHADRLGDGDLHLLHVVAVPDGLEDRVVEAEAQDVLDRLLPEVVVDSVDLVLTQQLVERDVERPGRLEIGAEGLLVDHPPPAVRFVQEARIAQALRGGLEELWREREIVEASSRSMLFERGLERLQAGGVGHIRGHVVHALLECAPAFLQVIGHLLGDLRAELRVAQRASRHADHARVLGESAVLREAGQRGHQLALGEVARGPEDHDLNRHRPVISRGWERLSGLRLRLLRGGVGGREWRSRR